MIRPVNGSVFQFILGVSDGVEVRALCRKVPPYQIGKKHIWIEVSPEMLVGPVD